MPIHDIAKIDFGILSPEDIRKMAVCKIDSSSLNGPGTVYDPRMGSVMDNDRCVTCNLKKECWGHFGYIELAEPILHPMYYKMISTFLKCFCKKCYKLLLSEEQIEMTGFAKMKGERKFKKILDKLEKSDICFHCSSPQPKIIYKSKDMIISMEYKHKKGDTKLNIVLTVEEIKKIFDNVTDNDVRTLGFDPSRTHPKNLVLTLLPVIPPCSRPYVISDGNICDDDITTQLIDIVKANNALLNGEDLQEQKRQKISQTLKFKISTMMNNSKALAKHPTDSRPLKGLKERLSGKTGRIRNNLMGNVTGRVSL